MPKAPWQINEWQLLPSVLAISEVLSVLIFYSLGLLGETSELVAAGGRMPDTSKRTAFSFLFLIISPLRRSFTWKTDS